MPTQIIVILLALTSACTSAPKKSKEVKTMDGPSPYSRLYASARRDSFIDTTTKSNGRPFWSKELGVPVTKYWRPNLYLWQNNIVVTNYDDMLLFDRDGKKIWAKKRGGDTPIVIENGLLYYKNPSKFISAIDTKDQFIHKSAPFPGGMGEQDEVNFFYPRKDDFVAVIYNRDQNDHQQDGKPARHEPKITVIINRYPTTYGDWLYEIPGSDPLPALFDSGKNNLFLYIDNLHLINTATEKEVYKKRLFVSEPTEWSLDRSGNPCFLYAEKSKAILSVYDSAGTKKWQWTGETSESWLKHPPLHSASGRILSLTNERIIAFEKEKILWSFNMKTGTEDMSFAVILKDDSVLVANGKILTHLDKGGKKIFSFEAPSEILSQPIVDTDGNIFIATEKNLIRL